MLITNIIICYDENNKPKGFLYTGKEGKKYFKIYRNYCFPGKGTLAYHLLDDLEKSLKSILECFKDLRFGDSPTTPPKVRQKSKKNLRKKENPPEVWGSLQGG